jgi:hypothetical protein
MTSSTNIVTPVKDSKMIVSPSFEESEAMPAFSGDDLTKKLHFSVWPHNEFGTFKVVTNSLFN